MAQTSDTNPINLRIPGPTPVPPAVLQAMARPMIDHRGPEFAAIITHVTEQLKYFFQTSGDILTFPASGSGAMEAAVVNLFSPGDAVAAITIGAFGNRFAKIAETFGTNVTRIEFPLGQAADVETVLSRLAEIADLRGVIVTHNETSTGVTNDLKTLAAAIRAQYPDVIIAVDAVSSLSCVDLRMDEWDLDVVFTGSQKGWMVPPGLAMIGVGPRAWKANQQARIPRLYWDFAWAKRSLDKGQTPYTPPVSIFFALEVSLEMMQAEGREAIFARHQAVADLTRIRARELGLELLADPAYASNTVTAIKAPAGIEVKTLRKGLREQERVVIAGGQEQLEGKIVRVGHLGHVHEPDIAATMDALERQLVALGYQVPETARPR
ncbi:MAG TPA: alanine--glyoxylate aminotransferase family protein [Ktedonobacterales bacterium]|nr:alanine--glyoxylate aminotransferase family protein [Ktedonobacterales bacterium]